MMQPSAEINNHPNDQGFFMKQLRKSCEFLQQPRFVEYCRVCHGFRLKKRDDYFRVIFDHFFELSSILGGS